MATASYIVIFYKTKLSLLYHCSNGQVVLEVYKATHKEVQVTLRSIQFKEKKIRYAGRDKPY